MRRWDNDDTKSLLVSYCLLRQHNRQLDTEGRYSEGVYVLGHELKDRGIDVHNPDEMKNALLARK